MKKEIIKKELFRKFIGKSIEFIYCSCGCGFTTSKYKIENGCYPNHNKPNKFIKGHGMIGRHFSEEARRNNSIAQTGKKLSKKTKRKISLATKGENNPRYGKPVSQKTRDLISKANSKDIVGYSRLHYKIRRLLPRPDFCVMCLIKPSYEVACITHIYNMDFKNWMWVCRSCHKIHDHKLKKK